MISVSIGIVVFWKTDFRILSSLGTVMPF